MAIHRNEWTSPFGRLRGEVLLGLAGVDIAQAWTLLTDHSSAINDWFESVLPPTVWAIMWAGVGLVCLIHAFRRDDHIGFVAAIGVKIVWVIGALAGSIAGEVSPVGVLLWGFVAVIVWRIAALADPVYRGRLLDGDDQV